MKQLFLLIAIALIGFSCNQKKDPLIVQGMRPVYAESSSWKNIISLPASPLKNLGKLYYKDSLLYAIEKNRGIHVVDNHDPANPVNLRFIQIAGVNDVAIKGNILYADNVLDLIAVDISNPDNPHVVKRIENHYVNGAFYTPPGNYSGYFECVDPAKGVPIYWEETELTDPKCKM